MNKIDRFSGVHSWLSNFWLAPIVITGWQFPSTEHAYQAAKSLNPTDWELIQKILFPGRAKKYGATLQLRPDWDTIKLDVMRELTKAKYDQNPDLKALLLETRGMELIEGNECGDTFWGKCSRSGVGQNHFGRIIMDYRDGYLAH